MYVEAANYRGAIASQRVAMIGVFSSAAVAFRLAQRLIRDRGASYVMGKAWHAVKTFDVASQVRVARTLGDSNTRRFVQSYPKVMFKHLSPYLAGSFKVDARARIVHHHYRTLSKLVDRDFLMKILEKPITLWQLEHEGVTAAIALSFPKDTCYEGDLSLVMLVNGVEVADISCTLVPGEEVGVAHESVLMIGRVQGRAGSGESIRLCKDMCLGISPSNLLMSAVQSLAFILGAKSLVGVSDKQQLMRHMGYESEFHFSYDTFWAGYGGELNAHDLFDIPIPFARKTLEEVPPKRRSQTKRKRAFKDHIAEEMNSNFQLLCAEHGDGAQSPS